jgi:SAM-dependent methyltransferase
MTYQLNSDNIYLPTIPVVHRDYEYDQGSFEMLREMQDQHFWYRGRHRFLLSTLERHLPQSGKHRAAIDLGGGCGGWVRYLAKERPALFAQLALADSSLVALAYSEAVLPPNAQRFQVDLMNLKMREKWDTAFLLDVVEHLPDDQRALEQARDALKPGGLLFVAAPAFPVFWSYNDDMAHHLRRYTQADFMRLAKATDLTLLDYRYFMFLLSPLYLLSRFKHSLKKLSDHEKRALVLKQHAIPAKPINGILSAIFGAETSLGQWLRFPWGTSILGVFKKHE